MLAAGREGGRAGSPRALLGVLVGGTVVGSMSVAFVVSFAALIYSGPLSGTLGAAIPLGLVGASVMVLAGIALHALPVLSQPQDATTVILASGAAAIAARSGEAAGPTALAFVACATLAAGAIIYLAGRLRLGHLARIMPYPVLGGFLAATGYLLTTGAIGMVLDRHVGAADLPGLVGPQMALWAPWLALAAAMALATRRSESDMVLPAAILAGIGAFYAWLALAGIPTARASEMGLLLGPFPEGGLGDLAGMAGRVDWPAVLSQMPLVPAVAALAGLGTLLNMSGIEVSLKRPTELDADLRAVGITNVAAAASGSWTGYPMIGETLLAHRLRLSGRVAALFIAAICTGAALVGLDQLAMLPRGIFAAVIGYLGIDLLLRWLWEERRSMPPRDLAIVLLILTVAAFVGFLEAIAFGFVLAATMFVASYARLDPVRARSTLAARRSSVERGAAQAGILGRTGEGVVIVELNGYLFFGSAHSLARRVRAELEAGGLRELILDLSRVPGLDSSAAEALGRIAEACEESGIRLSLCALPPEAGALLRARRGAGAFEMHGTLDAALVDAEERLLEGAAETEAAAGLLGVFAGAPEGLIQTVHLGAGEVLFEEGAGSRDIFVLRSGEMRAEVARADAPPLTVARYRPGALLGEMAFYGDLPRTASVVAETPAELVRVDPGRLREEAPAFAAGLHAAIAGHLAQRLARTTRLVRQMAD